VKNKEFWERLAKLPGGDKDPFEERYGPTPDCFSNNDIVRMFELGAEKRAAAHLETCDDCSERVDQFAEARGVATYMIAAAAAAPARKPGLFGSWFGPKPVPAVASGLAGQALAYAPSACFVRNGTLENVKVQLLTKKWAELRDMKVYLCGSILEGSEPIVVEQVKDVEGYPLIELHNVKASSNVMSTLKDHARLTQQIEVCVGTSPSDVRLVGRTNIELRRA
jgi:hypothetical protein